MRHKRQDTNSYTEYLTLEEDSPSLALQCRDIILQVDIDALYRMDILVIQKSSPFRVKIAKHYLHCSFWYKRTSRIC